MKASYNWLRELVGDALTATPQELAARITAAGLEVEGMTEYGAACVSCIVVRVVSIRPHPTKSGLKLVMVQRGDRNSAVQEVVCGAPNVPEPGGLVVLAPLGAHLPAKNMTIAKRAIAGVESDGMLCSEAELGLTEDSSGILILPEACEPGTTLANAVTPSHDWIFEIGLTPNRPDGLGHVGLARDIAALYEIPWKMPRIIRAKADHSLAVDSLAKVEVKDFDRCPHYGAAAIVDVVVGPSPLWARYRLSALGVRSISNLVDVTNIVMLEYGHPMHAFDLDHVQDAKIVVRRATEDEPLTTLDGIARKMTADDLLICDGRGPVGIGGVMGGLDSEIKSTTKRVLFECAYFDPRGVRRTSRRLGLHTDASHRFERGVDPSDIGEVLARALALTQHWSPRARVATGEIHAQAPEEAKKREITLRSEKLDALLGVKVPFAEACGILKRLGFEAKKTEDARATFLVPTHRPDCSREADLIEEVLRVRGMDTIPAILPAIHPTREMGPREERAQRARAIAKELGLSEAIPYAFCSRDLLAKARAPEASVVLENPLSELQAVMRTSVMPGLMEALANARRHGEKSVRLFAIGPAFFASKKEGELPEERTELAVILGGDRDAWLAKPEPVDAWDAKGVALALVERLTGKTAEIASTKEDARLHPRAAANILVDGKRVGVFGLVHPDVCDALDLGNDVACVEISLDALASPSAPQCKPIPRFPASTRDLAMVVHDDVIAGDVLRAVREAAGIIAENVSIFDRFRGGAVPEHHASLAFRVVYRAADRTLTDIEVDQAHAKVTEAVSSRFGATLRA